MRQSRNGQERHLTAPNLHPATRTSGVSPMRPDPQAHAEILVLTYGLQTASWIAETNKVTARRSDVPYWASVRRTIEHLRETQLGS